MLTYNKQFVARKSYEKYETDRYPNKRMVVFTCMEARLIELLPKALNIHNGDVKMIKNAGAILRKSYDSVMKSILVAVYELQAEEVVVIGHYDCGMCQTDTNKLFEKMIARGVSEETFQEIENENIHLHEEFSGFHTVTDSVHQSVDVIRNHPLLPKDVKVHGLVIDPKTGKVDIVSIQQEPSLKS